MPTKRTSKDRAKHVADRRFALLMQLGSICVDCNEDDIDVLEFDHIYGRDYDITLLNRWTRIARLEKEAKQGLIAIRCKSCNSSKGTKGTLGMADTGPLFPGNPDQWEDIPY